jgi:hypothetical protein
MSGLNTEVCFAIARIKALFVDDTGYERPGIATGLWMSSKGKIFFVTNRHTLDLSMKYTKPHTLVHLQIELRKKNTSGFSQETKFFKVQNSSIILGDRVDLAIIIAPTYEESVEGFEYRTLDVDQWGADADFFLKYCQLASDIFFVGFPMNFFDDHWKFPIARHAIVASVPHVGFSNKEILTSEVLLASGLSFEGGSGSPVFSSQRGMKINTDNGSVESGYCPQKLIGIMTGHLQFEQGKEPLNRKQESFTRHSGLSYFTKITALRELLHKNGL